MDRIPTPPPGVFPFIAKRPSRDESGEPTWPKPRNSKPQPPIESYPKWMAIVVGESGEFEIRSSESWDHLQPRMEKWAPNLLDEHQTQQPRAGSSTTNKLKSAKRMERGIKAETDQNQPQTQSASFVPESSISYPFSTNPKRRRTDSELLDETSIVPSTPDVGQLPAPETAARVSSSGRGVASISSKDLPVLNIGVLDHAGWLAWFNEAFKVIQQQGCRYIAKEWIKLIHPKKQSTHPYNGNFPRNQRASPDRTKPPYWPHAVRHKEPDHIDKNDRTTLLVHLIMNTPQQEITPANMEGNPGGKEILAVNLLEVLRKRKVEFKDKWQVIEIIVWAREQLESYEGGGCDADLAIGVPDYSELSRRHPKSNKAPVGSDQSTKMEYQETPDHGQGSETGTAARPASPALGAPTLVDSEDEDGPSAVNVSFSSATTQSSSHAARPILRPKPEPMASNSHMVELHSIPMESVASQHALNYHHAVQLPQRQATMPGPWQTSAPSTGHTDGAFAHGVGSTQAPMQMMDPAHFDHVLFHQPPPNNIHGVMGLMPYPDSPPFAYYPHDMNNVANGVGTGQDYTLHDAYGQPYPHHPPSA